MAFPINIKLLTLQVMIIFLNSQFRNIKNVCFDQNRHHCILLCYHYQPSTLTTTPLDPCYYWFLQGTLYILRFWTFIGKNKKIKSSKKVI